MKCSRQVVTDDLTTSRIAPTPLIDALSDKKVARFGKKMYNRPCRRKSNMQIQGIVSPGKRIGRKLGFPTANIALSPGEAAPAKNGVYIARISLADGRSLPCILSQGLHPTLPEGGPTIEAHILDFDGDLYGQRVGVEYLKFLRDELRFDTLEELRAQIADDERRARAWFSAPGL
jgi:riboflavin kinase/FMN adenylyltransferase